MKLLNGSTHPTINRLLRINPVRERTGYPKSTIYHAIRNGTFPAPIKTGERMSAWLESEVTAIINARIAGKSTDDIKTLVKELEAKRTSMGVAA